MRTRAHLLALACAATVVAGCGQERESPSSRSPTSTTAAPTSTSTPAASSVVTAYFLRDELVGPVARRAGGPAVLRTALEAMFDGPTGSERRAGFTSAVPSGSRLRDVAVDGDTAVIDVNAAFESGGGSASMQGRLAQLTYTATQFGNVQRVTLRIEGKPVSTFGSEGVAIDGPLTRAGFEDQTPAILVDRPAYGERLPAGTFTARGTSNTFEATHQMQLLDAAGAAVVDDFVTATSGTGTRGTWTKEVPVPERISGVATLRVSESSAEDGRPINQVDIALVLG